MEIFRLTTQMEKLCNLHDSLIEKMTTPVSDPIKKCGKGKQVSKNQKLNKV